MAIRLTLDKHTLSRWPHPLGRRIKINATLSGLGASAIVESLDAGALGTSVSSMGVWANLDAMSITSLGYLANLPLLQTAISNAVILTSHAPLTRGWGHGEIAEAEDISVLVDGLPVDIIGYDPVVGVLILDQSVDAGSTVQVEYFYTPNPTLPITHLNAGSFVLNQWNSHTLQPFAYNSVLGPHTNPQPQVVEHRYRALDYPYTATLNDPTSMVLNEPKHQITLPRFQRVNSQESIFFEGDALPETPWEWMGPLPIPAATLEGGAYVIEDMSSSVDAVTSTPSFWKRDIDLTFDHALILNFRTALVTWDKIGDFTGIAAGWADDKSLAFIGFLEIGDIKTVGILTQGADESEWEAYSALTATATDNGGDINLIASPSQLPLSVGQRVAVEGAPYTVLSSEYANAQWEVVLDSNMPATGTVRVFPEIDWETIQTYRVSKSTGGLVNLLVGGGILPVATTYLTAVAPEIFDIMENNTLFFGAPSRQGESKSLWDFVRYSVLPAQTIEQDAEVLVNSEFEVLPEEEDTPWTLTDNHGYQKTFAADYVLTQAASQPYVGGGVNYTRIEPFLTSKSLIDITTRVRVHTYGYGMPAFLTIADDKKEITLAFADSGLVGSFADTSALSLLTKGYWAGMDAGSLKSRGYISGYNIIPSDRFLAGFGGEQSFDASGWTDGIDTDETTFVDHHMHVVHVGVPSYAQQSVTVSGSNTEFVTGTRLRFGTYTLGGDDSVSVWFGADAGNAQVFLKPWDDGTTKKLVFCTSSGALVLDGGNPIGFTFDWDDGEFHHYRITRAGGNVTAFVDGIYKAVFDVALLPVSALPVGTVLTKFGLGTNAVTVDVDYAFAHSTVYETRRVGVYQGGDLLDTSSYEWVPLEWLGTFAEIRIRKNVAGTVEVIANGISINSREYSELPDRRNDRFNTNTELGYVQFGTNDPASYAEVLWDYVRYSIINQRERQQANNLSVINRHNVISSGEPYLDDSPEDVEVAAYTANLVLLSETGMYADRVLAVTSLDGFTTHPFAYDSGTNTVALLGAGTSETHVRVVFYHRKPYTMSYLENNWAATRLNEGTPPVPLKQQVTLLVEDIFDPGYIDTGDIQNDPADFIFVEGSRVIKFTRNDEAWYESLSMLSLPDGGSLNLISPACDDLGLIGILFEGPFADDTYTSPLQGDESTTHQHRIGRFNQALFNDVQMGMAGIQSPVSFRVDILEDEVYTSSTDEALIDAPYAVLSDFFGTGMFNNALCTLNVSVPVTDPVYANSYVASANTITFVDYPIDFTAAILYP